MISIPIFNNNSSHYSIDIELEEKMHTIFFGWNAREEKWYISFMTSEDNYIVAGVKLVANYQLLKPYRYIESLPPGDFMVVRKDQSTASEITYDNLGVDFEFLYLTEEEVNAIEEEAKWHLDD